MKTNVLKLTTLLLLITTINTAFAQRLVEAYNPAPNDSLRIGTGDKDYLPLIQRGYTLMLPDSKTVEGVLIFLEDSQYDKKNKSAKQVYEPAVENGFAVLSVSTEVPLDFYFINSSIHTTHNLIQQAFVKHNLPNKNIYFLGASLTGHRAMKYIEFMHKNKPPFRLNIQGVVLCNFTMDWTRKWHQHERDIRLNKINLWEPKFINYMLETHLNGTPETAPEKYHEFSTYSYSDKQNENISYYKNFAIRVYVEPAINYRLKKYYRTLYENNTTDMVGFLAELELAGNSNTELIVFQSDPDPMKHKPVQATWDAIDKYELMDWVLKQTNIER